MLRRARQTSSFLKLQKLADSNSMKRIIGSEDTANNYNMLYTSTTTFPPLSMMKQYHAGIFLRQEKDVVKTGIHEATTGGLSTQAEKPKFVPDTNTSPEIEDWHRWSIDTLLMKINESRKAIDIPAFPAFVVAQTKEKLVVAPSAGDLKNYTVEKLEAEGIKTAVATAIVEFICKYKPAGITESSQKQQKKLSREEKLTLLENLITVASAEQVKKRQERRSVDLNFKFKSFVHREKGIEIVQVVANKNLDAYMRNSSTKQEHTFLIVSGGSGSGKTRASNEVGNILRSSAIQHMLPQVFGSTCEVYIDFSNGDKIDKWEYDLLPSQVLGLRLFVKALREEVTLAQFVHELGVDTVSRLSHQGIFDTEFVLSMVSKIYRQHLKHKEDEALPFVVILDEFQKTIETFPEKKEWKQIAKTMGVYMCTANKNLQSHRLLLFPVIAGTLPSREISFELTEYGNEFFPLPPFPFSVSMDLAKQEGVRKLYLDTNPEMKRFWYLMGLIPRSLEFTVNEIERYQTTPEASLITQVERLFVKVMKSLNLLYRLNEQPYFASSTDDPKLLWYAITGAPVSDSEEWISKLEREGRIYMTKERKLLLPYPVFWFLSNNHLDILPPSCIPMLKASFSWREFEKLDLRVLAQRRREAKSIRELFPGAHGREAILNTTFSPSPCQYLLEKNTYLIGQKTKFTVEDSKAPIYIEGQEEAIIGEQRYNYVFQAKKNHLLVDGRLFVQSNSKKFPDLVFFIQYKYSEDPDPDHEEQVKVSPSTWYNTLAPNIRSAYKRFRTYFVYITNANIPKKAKAAVDTCNNLLVIDQSCANAYYALNLIPYYSTAIGDEADTAK